jgi:hypothetical protein
MVTCSDKFKRATKGMRFHIYTQPLETYVSVLGITEGFWGIKKTQLTLAVGDGILRDEISFKV